MSPSLPPKAIIVIDKGVQTTDNSGNALILWLKAPFAMISWKPSLYLPPQSTPTYSIQCGSRSVVRVRTRGEIGVSSLLWSAWVVSVVHMLDLVFRSRCFLHSVLKVRTEEQTDQARPSSLGGCVLSLTVNSPRLCFSISTSQFTCICVVWYCRLWRYLCCASCERGIVVVGMQCGRLASPHALRFWVEWVALF